MAQALPAGWLEGSDPVYRIPFYYNTVTKSSTWHRPLRAADATPHAAGGDYNVSARCEGCTVPGEATLEHVTFGDVWYCGGQSNMALKMLHTFSRNVSRDKVLAGAYANIRIHGMHSNQLNPTQPWSTLRDALATDPDSEKSNFIWYSATCYYFGESLSDALAAGEAPPPEAAENLVVRVSCSMLEIYNGRVRDLFALKKKKGGGDIKADTGGLKVRMDPIKGPYAEGLTQKVVKSYVNVDALPVEISRSIFTHWS